jgi:hypothetical protein
MKFKILSAILVITFCTAGQSNKLTPKEAKYHIGETATVCGKVASAQYATQSKGQPTLLNLEEPYP